MKEEQIRYDAIFMDHMMPDMDGIEATRIIREEIGTEYAGTVPIIALPANAIAGNEQMFLEHGFQAFLSKPIDISLMDMVLEQWVHKKEVERVLSENREESAAPGKAAEVPGSGIADKWRIDGLDLKGALRRFGGDEEILLAVLRSFAENTPSLLERVRDPGKENLQECTTLVHGIKGSSYGICARALGKMAETLEHEAQLGNLDFVLAFNKAFLDDAAQLLAGLRTMLEEVNREKQKPTRIEPDPALLDRLRTACENYDMDGVDAAMTELEGYAYEDRQELVAWLRERVDRMDFQQILDRLPARRENGDAFF